MLSVLCGCENFLSMPRQSIRDAVLPLQHILTGPMCKETPLAFLMLYACWSGVEHHTLLRCCSDDDVLLDELDSSEEEGEDVEAEKRREARQRLRKEAEVASYL